MFLVAVTKSDLSDKLSSERFETFQMKEKHLTLVYDTFLSKIDSRDHLFVSESLFPSRNYVREITLSQVKINLNEAIMDFSRPSGSGRPIFYNLDSEGNFFCSTHISMLRKAGVLINENRAVLPEFFAFRYIMPPNSLYENIYQIPEGSQLNVKIFDGKIRLKLINDFNPYTNNNLDEFKDFRKKISDTVSKSIAPLNECKDRLGVLLSGGIDSSLLLRILQNNNIFIDETFSTGYSFENFEKEYAESSAEYLGVKHKHYDTTLDQYLPGFVESISAAEQPLPHMQSFLLHLLFKDGIPKNKHIILNGAGTELNCNSTNFKIYQFKKNSFKIRLLKLLAKLPITSNWQSAKWAAKNQSRIDCEIESPKNLLWEQDPIASFNWTTEHFNIKESELIAEPLNLLRSFGEHSIYEITALYDYLGANHATQSVWSKIGESQRKIIYYPYTDNLLTNYIFSIPPRISYRKYKYVFKEVASYCGVPSQIIKRRKLGFNPLTNLDLLKKEFFEPLFPVASKVFDKEKLLKLNVTNWGYNFWTMWNILNYSIWKRLCIENEPVKAILEEVGKN